MFFNKKKKIAKKRMELEKSLVGPVFNKAREQLSHFELEQRWGESISQRNPQQVILVMEKLSQQIKSLIDEKLKSSKNPDKELLKDGIDIYDYEIKETATHITQFIQEIDIEHKQLKKEYEKRLKLEEQKRLEPVLNEAREFFTLCKQLNPNNPKKVLIEKIAEIDFMRLADLYNDQIGLAPEAVRKVCDFMIAVVRKDLENPESLELLTCLPSIYIRNLSLLEDLLLEVANHRELTSSEEIMIRNKGLYLRKKINRQEVDRRNCPKCNGRGGKSTVVGASVSDWKRCTQCNGEGEIKIYEEVEEAQYSLSK